MGALRWSLLVAGLLFLAALLCWESWRARRGHTSPHSRSPDQQPDHAVGNEGPKPQRASEPRIADVPGASPPLITLPDEPLTSVPERPEAPDGSSAPASPDGDAERGTEEPAAAAPVAPDESLLPDASTSPLIVQWPPEQNRRIFSVRIVARGEQRLQGRTLRQALTACGFSHGRLGIFHQAAPDGRALLSAANLSKPGILDPQLMDFQRFSGLSVFAVLPGPVGPEEAFDQLVRTGRDLAARVHGRLEDDCGKPLDTAGVQALRQRLTAKGGERPPEPSS